MLLQTRMTNRRQFLERSALGFGGAFLLPSLLTSCTDHRIPDPTTPIALPPLVGDYQVNWNDLAKESVKLGVEAIPEVGEILGPLVDIFWPSTKEDVWSQVKDQTEAIVNQKIAAAVYQQVSDDLKGLYNSITLYRNELKGGTPSDIKTNWIITKNLFVDALPHFQSQGYELSLLGLFAQFANMYLALLRDGVTHGKSWDRSDDDQQQDVIDLQTAIKDFIDYASQTVINGASALNTKRDDHACEPFRTNNKYIRQMTLTVIDFVETWPYYDVNKYPNGAKDSNENPIKIFTREIYSDPYGTCDDSGPIVLPYPYPTQLPTYLSVWGWDRVDSVQLTYPTGSGPAGVTQTPRMGLVCDNNCGSNQPPHGGTFTISPIDNPILQAKVTVSDVVNALYFKFNDGTITNKLGGNYQEGGDTDWLGYTDAALSSIHVNGVSRWKQSADCVVFGFQWWQSPKATMRAIGAIYITSPKEHSAADFAKAFPSLGIGANLITEEYKAARRAHWAYIDAYAKAHK